MARLFSETPNYRYQMFCLYHNFPRKRDFPPTGVRVDTDYRYWTCQLLILPIFSVFHWIRIQTFCWIWIRIKAVKIWRERRKKNVSKKRPIALLKPLQSRVGIKKPTQKSHPKKHLKKPTKNVFFGGFLFWVFFKFFIFYENNTNFSLSNRFFMNK